MTAPRRLATAIGYDGLPHGRRETLLTPQAHTPAPETRPPCLVWVVLGSLVILGLLIVLDGVGKLKLGQEGTRGSFALGFFLIALGISIIVLAHWLTRARRDWAGEPGAVAARPRVHLALAWGMALLCLAFLGLLLPSRWQELKPERFLGNPWALGLVALFAPFVWAVVLTVRRWRSAEAVFLPGERAEMGGRLRGIIHTRLRHRPRGSVTLTLECLHRTITGGAETEERLWQGHRELPVEDLRPGSGGLEIPVSIPVPGARELALPTWGTIEWRLTVRGKLAGPDLDAAFRVEVREARG